MAWFPNTNRLREIVDALKVRKAAEAILAFRSKEVLTVLLWGWVVLLGMVFTLLLTIRIALLLPLWR